MEEWIEKQERITSINKYGNIEVKNNEYCTAVEKLKEYEDLQEKLGITMKQLLDICGDFLSDKKDSPYAKAKKAVLLTEDTAEEWKNYKKCKNNNLLVKLPCEIGDKIWYLNGHFILECRVNSFIVGENGVEFICIEYYDTETNKTYSHTLDTEYIGKTLFFNEDDIVDKIAERMEERNEK